MNDLFFFFISFFPYCYRSFVLYEFHILLVIRRRLDEMRARTSYIQNTITVFQHHRLLFINLNYYSFLFCLLACLFVYSLLKTLSFSPDFCLFFSFAVFFVHIKHTYTHTHTSSDMKKQMNENDRQLSVNKMMNVRRRI